MKSRSGEGISKSKSRSKSTDITLSSSLIMTEYTTTNREHVKPTTSRRKTFKLSIHRSDKDDDDYKHRMDDIFNHNDKKEKMYIHKINKLENKLQLLTSENKYFRKTLDLYKDTLKILTFDNNMYTQYYNHQHIQHPAPAPAPDPDPVTIQNVSVVSASSALESLISPNSRKNAILKRKKRKQTNKNNNIRYIQKKSASSSMSNIKILNHINSDDQNKTQIIYSNIMHPNDIDEKEPVINNNNQSKLNIVEELQNAKEESINSSHSTGTSVNSIETTSSIISSSDDLISHSSDSDCYHLFGENDDDVSDDDDINENIQYNINVPTIYIPQNDRELLKKVMPAYKYHLEMIDDDGKRREREKQQKQMKLKYAKTRKYAQMVIETVIFCNIYTTINDIFKEL